MAWQPLTFRGVANFAQASGWRLFLVQIVTALISGGVLVWFCEISITPILHSLLGQLPEQCRLSEGRLDWKGATPVRLGEDAFLGIVVDLDRTGNFGQSSDFLLDFSTNNLQVSSLLGRHVLAYPASWRLDLDPLSLRPRWEAWHPFVYLGLGVAWGAVLMVAWAGLALLYTPVAAVLCFLMNRKCAWAGCYRLAGAALLPGAVFLNMAMVLYAFRQMELIGFLVAFGLHVLVGWLYLLLAPSCLPAKEISAKPVENPFATGPEQEEE
jgi:hypothetical protein